MNKEDCQRELCALLPAGWTGTVELDGKLDCDYALTVRANHVVVRASRLRNALCAVGDVESSVRSGRHLIDKRVTSPLPLRLVEAWAPMHSHMFLPMPEYHEHSWHIRMRERLSPDVLESEMEMAVIRFEKYVKLVAKQGFTHVVLDDQDYLVLFPKHPEIYPAGGHFHRRHLVYRHLFRRLLDIAAAHDLKFVLYCQELGYTPPTKAFFGNICPCNEKMWTYLEEKYDELAEVFPDFDGYMIKVSDSFMPLDGYYFHTDLFHHTCPACQHLAPLQRLKAFVDCMYRVVVQKHNRNLYYRTWECSSALIHVDVEKHRKLFAGIEDERAHPVLKYTKGDFMVSNRFHPGIGGMPNQIVEYQFKLEHDGHGSLPLYIGAVHQESLRENIAKGIAGIWTWPVGGGISSINNITHFKGFTRFAEANQFVFARTMLEPEVPHTETLAIWGDGLLGPGNGAPLGEILCFLTDAFRLTCNFGDLWTGSREYGTYFHHGWFYDWQHFRLGHAAMEAGGDDIRSQVLPFISDLDAAIQRMHRGAAMFREARESFERTVRRLPGYEHEYVTFLDQFMAAEAFANLCALWVETLLRFYSGQFTTESLEKLLVRLEAAKQLYDRNHGLFVTQCMDYFISMARRAPTDREQKIR